MPWEVEVSAPGKVILFGEHAVVYGCEGIVSAIDLRMMVRLQMENTCGIYVCGDGFLSQATLDLETIMDCRNRMSTLGISAGCFADSKSWIGNIELIRMVDGCLGCFGREARNSLGVLLILVIILGERWLDRIGFRFELISSVPAGGGLGSSAAFCSAVAASILIFINGETSLETILEWASVGECLIHGAGSSGIDTAASVFGGTIFFSRGTKPTKLESILYMPRFASILVSGIKRSTGNVVSKVRNRVDLYPAYHESLFGFIGAVSRHALTLMCGENDMGCFSRFRQLVIGAGKMLEALDLDLLSLAFIRCCLEDQVNPESFCGKITGAGCGGSYLYFFTDKDTQDEFHVRWNGLKDEIRAETELIRIHLDCTGIQYTLLQ